MRAFHPIKAIPEHMKRDEVRVVHHFGSVPNVPEQIETIVGVPLCRINGGGVDTICVHDGRYWQPFSVKDFCNAFEVRDPTVCVCNEMVIVEQLFHGPSAREYARTWTRDEIQTIMRLRKPTAPTLHGSNGEAPAKVRR